MEQANTGGPTAIVELNTSLAHVPIAFLRVSGIVIGKDRAVRLATRVVPRLTRWRVRGQRQWQWLSQDTRPIVRHRDRRRDLWLRTWTMAVMVVLPTFVAAALCLGAMAWLLR